MKYLTILLFSILFMSADSGQKQIVWKKLRTEEQVRLALQKRIPGKASASQVASVLLRQRHDFYKCYGDSMIAFISPSEPASLLIHRKWMMRFHFRADTLSRITIGEALTGP
jgi:hypothetical protein